MEKTNYLLGSHSGKRNESIKIKKNFGRQGRIKWWKDMNCSGNNVSDGTDEQKDDSLVEE